MSYNDKFMKIRQSGFEAVHSPYFQYSAAAWGLHDSLSSITNNLALYWISREEEDEIEQAFHNHFINESETPFHMTSFRDGKLHVPGSTGSSGLNSPFNSESPKLSKAEVISQGQYPEHKEDSNITSLTEELPPGGVILVSNSSSPEHTDTPIHVSILSKHPILSYQRLQKLKHNSADSPKFPTPNIGRHSSSEEMTEKLNYSGTITLFPPSWRPEFATRLHSILNARNILFSLAISKGSKSKQILKKKLSAIVNWTPYVLDTFTIQFFLGGLYSIFRDDVIYWPLNTQHLSEHHKSQQRMNSLGFAFPPPPEGATDSYIDQYLRLILFLDSFLDLPISIQWNSGMINLLSGKIKSSNRPTLTCLYYNGFLAAYASQKYALAKDFIWKLLILSKFLTVESHDSNVSFSNPSHIICPLVHADEDSFSPTYSDLDALCIRLFFILTDLCFLLRQFVDSSILYRFTHIASDLLTFSVTSTFVSGKKNEISFPFPIDPTTAVLTSPHESNEPSSPSSPSSSAKKTKSNSPTKTKTKTKRKPKTKSNSLPKLKLKLKSNRDGFDSSIPYIKKSLSLYANVNESGFNISPEENIISFTNPLLFSRNYVLSSGFFSSPTKDAFDSLHSMLTTFHLRLNISLPINKGFDYYQKSFSSFSNIHKSPGNTPLNVIWERQLLSRYYYFSKTPSAIFTHWKPLADLLKESKSEIVVDSSIQHLDLIEKALSSPIHLESPSPFVLALDPDVIESSSSWFLEAHMFSLDLNYTPKQNRLSVAAPSTTENESIFSKEKEPLDSYSTILKQDNDNNEVDENNLSLVGVDDIETHTHSFASERLDQLEEVSSSFSVQLPPLINQSTGYQFPIGAWQPSQSGNQELNSLNMCYSYISSSQFSLASALLPKLKELAKYSLLAKIHLFWCSGSIAFGLGRIRFAHYCWNWLRFSPIFPHFLPVIQSIILLANAAASLVLLTEYPSNVESPLWQSSLSELPMAYSLIAPYLSVQNVSNIYLRAFLIFSKIASQLSSMSLYSWLQHQQNLNSTSTSTNTQKANSPKPQIKNSPIISNTDSNVISIPFLPRISISEIQLDILYEFLETNFKNSSTSNTLKEKLSNIGFHLIISASSTEDD